MLNFCNTIFHTYICFYTVLVLLSGFCQQISYNFKNQEQRNFENGKTEYNYFNVISIISTPLFLVVQSNLTYPFFLNINKSLEKTEKYTKGFQHYSFICRCPGLSNLCTFGFSNRLAGSFVPDTELDLNRFRTSLFRGLVWHLST